MENRRHRHDLNAMNCEMFSICVLDASLSIARLECTMFIFFGTRDVHLMLNAKLYFKWIFNYVDGQVLQLKLKCSKSPICFDEITFLQKKL